jgi:hypothetical protein
LVFVGSFNLGEIMGKELSEIEDDYRTAYELEIEKYKQRLKLGKNKKKAREVFRKNFHKLLEKRNKASLRYMNKNKKKLLGMPEKKKKKEEKIRHLHVSHIDFRHRFSYYFKHWFHMITFELGLFFRSLRYNIVPSWLKYVIFRLGVFLSSVRVDFENLFNGIKRGFLRVFNRKYERRKEKVLAAHAKIKGKIDAWKEQRKAELEEKKQKETEAKEKLEEEMQKKKNQHEEALETLKELDDVIGDVSGIKPEKKKVFKK